MQRVFLQDVSELGEVLQFAFRSDVKVIAVGASGSCSPLPPYIYKNGMRTGICFDEGFGRCTLRCPLLLMYSCRNLEPFTIES